MMRLITPLPEFLKEMLEFSDAIPRKIQAFLFWNPFLPGREQGDRLPGMLAS
jgi:hypothetical protein